MTFVMSESDSEPESDVMKAAESIASEVGADTGEVKQGLRNLLEYSVPIDEAKRTIRRRYEAEESDSESISESRYRELSELSSGESNISVKAKVICSGKRSIRVNGDDRVITEGILSDNTDSVEFTSWKEFGYEAGDSIGVNGASTKEWNGNIQLNINASTEINEIQEIESLKEPFGVRELSELMEGDRAVELEVKVIESESRRIDGRDGEKEIRSGVFGDDSGRLPFTDWENRDINEDETYRLSNAYINEYRGIPQVNLGEFTELQEIEKEIRHTPPQRSLSEAIDKGGEFDVEIEGDIIEVKDGSGLVERCVDCGRILQHGECKVHGDIDGDMEMRTKAVIGDGTGAANLILDREMTEQITGMEMDEELRKAREAMDQGVVRRNIKQEIMGKRFNVRGNLSVGDYGANMEATDIKYMEVNPKTRALEVIDELY